MPDDFVSPPGQRRFVQPQEEFNIFEHLNEEELDEHIEDHIREYIDNEVKPEIKKEMHSELIESATLPSMLAMTSLGVYSAISYSIWMALPFVPAVYFFYKLKKNLSD